MTDFATAVAEAFADACGISTPRHEVVDKGGQQYLAIIVGSENEIYAKRLVHVLAQLPEDHPFKGNCFLKASHPDSWLDSTEMQLLQLLLSQSLTVGRSTLDSDLADKFIPFVGGEERLITASTNHVVYGRRGAGKSSLILYACKQAQKRGVPFSWIAMQQYEGRSDLLVIPQVLYEIISAVDPGPREDREPIKRLRSLVSELEGKGAALTDHEIAVKVPQFTRDFVPFVRRRGGFYIFVDDLHLLDLSLQPQLLGALYAIARGNNVHLKITAIENLARLSASVAGRTQGLQTPGDAQVIRLDYNLTNPESALNHIRSILESYVEYVGIPSLSRICPNAVLQRLVWVSAGVPRDALYVFNNAATKALAGGRRAITLTDVNMATADALTEKERYVAADAGKSARSIEAIVHDIRDFCSKDIRCNAFLVHIDQNAPQYKLIKMVCDLRFLHVLHPGITPKKAGDKFEALMLDYGFYLGFRRAQSVKEFKSRPEMPTAKELRTLKRYNYEERLANLPL